MTLVLNTLKWKFKGACTLIYEKRMGICMLKLTGHQILMWANKARLSFQNFNLSGASIWWLIVIYLTNLLKVSHVFVCHLRINTYRNVSQYQKLSINNIIDPVCYGTISSLLLLFPCIVILQYDLLWTLLCDVFHSCTIRLAVGLNIYSKFKSH